ncbi:MAG TPA: type II toxin-antitoxin system MqsR family toxin, partial [Longimicrobium sp.]|nr:type II toxin-antitoxin system MqsR family toxin [Longimicrobium sp.]
GQGSISSLITFAATKGAAELNLSPDDVVTAVLMLQPRDFYKSMESEKIPGLWQDVYHLNHHRCWLYIKLQLLADGRAVVVQFKEK